MELTLRIVCEDLAKIDFGAYTSAGAGRTRFFLGIQKGQEVVESVPVGGDTDTATFTALFRVAPQPDGGTNFLGPYAQGTPAARFSYLCWRAEHADGSADPFGRVKLPLKALRWERAEAAANAGTPVVVRVSLLGKRGGPLFATVPAESVRWEA